MDPRGSSLIISVRQCLWYALKDACAFYMHCQQCTGMCQNDDIKIQYEAQMQSRSRYTAMSTQNNAVKQ